MVETAPVPRPQPLNPPINCGSVTKATAARLWGSTLKEVKRCARFVVWQPCQSKGLFSSTTSPATNMQSPPNPVTFEKLQTARHTAKERDWVYKLCLQALLKHLTFRTNFALFLPKPQFELELKATPWTLRALYAEPTIPNTLS